MLLASALLDALAGWRAFGLLRSIPRTAEKKMPAGLPMRFAKVSSLNYLMGVTGNLSDLPFAALVLTGAHQLTGVAILGLAYRFAMYFLRFLVAPLTGIQMPLFARIYADKSMDKLQHAYAALSKFLMFFLIPCGVVGAVLAHRLIPLLFTTSYTESVTPAIILIFFLFAESMLAIPQVILVAFESYRPFIESRLISLVSVPLLLILVPTYGFIGAALAIGIARVLAQLSATFFAIRQYHLAFPFLFLFKILGASLLAGAILWWARDMSWLVLGPALVVSGLVFALAFKLLGGFDAADKGLLAQVRFPGMNRIIKWL